MRFHIGFSFKIKKILKWFLLGLFGVLSFFHMYAVQALTIFNPNTAWVTGDIKEAFYSCDSLTDTCTWVTDNTTSASGNIPWTSSAIQGQDYTGAYEYTVEAIRAFGVGIYNNSSASGTIPANSFVTIKIQFTNLDKFTKGPNFSNPGVALRTTSNTNLYGAFDQSFVCNGNSCTLSYKTPNQTTKGIYFFWNTTTSDKNLYFLRNDTSIDYTLGISSYSFTYENSTADTTNAINQQTQVIASWDSTINQSINNVSNVLNKVFSNTNDILTDDTPPNIPNFSDINVSNDSAISGLLTLPISLLNKINNNLDNTCTPYTIPFGLTGGSETLTFPCINPQDYLGQTIWRYIDLFVCLFMIYEIAMLIISSFESITSLDDGFNQLYKPKHEDTGYKPKHGGD